MRYHSGLSCSGSQAGPPFPSFFRKSLYQYDDNRRFRAASSSSASSSQSDPLSSLGPYSSSCQLGGGRADRAWFGPRTGVVAPVVLVVPHPIFQTADARDPTAAEVCHTLVYSLLVFDDVKHGQTLRVVHGNGLARSVDDGVGVHAVGVVVAGAVPADLRFRRGVAGVGAHAVGVLDLGHGGLWYQCRGRDPARSDLRAQRRRQRWRRRRQRQRRQQGRRRRELRRRRRLGTCGTVAHGLWRLRVLPGLGRLLLCLHRLLRRGVPKGLPPGLVFVRGPALPRTPAA